MLRPFSKLSVNTVSSPIWGQTRHYFAFCKIYLTITRQIDEKVKSLINQKDMLKKGIFLFKPFFGAQLCKR
jgi:hypothetical protein